MIPVCKDKEDNGDSSMWFYAAGEYTRRDHKGAIKGHITGANIPNPNEVWKARCQTFGGRYPADKVSHPETGEVIRLRPTEAAFKLFEHYQGVQAECQI